MQLKTQGWIRASLTDSAAVGQPLFTLFVPTYNRLNLLPRLLQSVEAQSFRDFELLIVDDGSQDNSYEYLCHYQQQARFPMHVIYQENQGRHAAFNTAFEVANGLLFTTINSDDALAPNALERFAYWWEKAQEYNQTPPIVGVEGLCASLETGEIIGTPFPKSPMVADHIEVYFKHGCWGDAVRAVRTDIIRQYRFPQIPSERYLPPSYLWNRLGFDRHKTLYFNEVLCYKEYRSDGVSKNRVRVRGRSPRGAELYFRDFLTRAYADGRVPRRYLIRYTANWVRYALYFTPLSQVVREAAHIAPPLMVRIAGGIIGFALFQRDRLALASRRHG